MQKLYCNSGIDIVKISGVLNSYSRINASDISLASEENIEAARKAYDALSDEEKAQVTSYDKLVKAEKALQEYKDKYVPEAVKPDSESTGYDSVKISWNAVEKVDSYDIYRYNENNKKPATDKEELLLQEGYELVTSVIAETAAKTEYTDTGLKTGKTYKYLVIAVNHDQKNRKIEVKSTEVTATPNLNQVAKLKLTSGKKLVKVKWSAVAGATGYKIYRSMKKSSGFKHLKTLKGMTSYINKKLKTGKKYYYKVIAYRTVNGCPVYGEFSAVKLVKVK